METVLNSFTYDPKSPSGVSCSRTGKNLGYRRKDGYWILSHKGRQWLAHRIVWGLHHGAFEVDRKMAVDHIDRNPSNNLIENLRYVTQSKNIENSGARSHNRSGVKLVRICPKTGNFVVRIKRVTVGTFHTIEEAMAARDEHLKQ